MAAMPYDDRKASTAPARQATITLLPLLLLPMLVAAAIGFVAYVLWPRWPAAAVSPDAPSLPITIAGVAFNVPPAAMRVKVQRRPGAHDRVDLAFLWPSLAPLDPSGPPNPPAARAASGPTHPLERVFVTIATAGDTLPPAERVRSVYPRYTDSAPTAGPGGLAILAFRRDTPYQGEDLIYDAGQPESFLVRCTRDGTWPIPGMCLYALRIEGADLVVRFPRDWLDNWRAVKSNIGRLTAGLRARAR